MYRALVIATLLAAAPGERVLVDRIAAVVNDDVITLSDVQAAAKPYVNAADSEDRKKLLYKDILRQLIDERLLTQQISDAKIEVTEAEVQRAIEDILRQNKLSREQLEEAIRARGMSMGQYLQDLESQLIRLKLVDMKVRSRVSIPAADIKAEFESRTRGQEKKEMVTIRHLFFRWDQKASDEEKQRIVGRANDARARITKGEAFEVVAKEVSEGPTASTGGSLGEMERKSLMPELAAALEGHDVGKLTAPVPTSNGVHVVLLEDRQLRAAVTFAEMRDRIYQELYQKRVEEQMKIWLEELRSASAVDVRL